MNIIITGATGAIGQNLVKALSENKHKLTIISRNTKKVIDLFGSKVQAVDWHELHKIKAEPEIIIHMAGHNIGSSLWTKKNLQLAYDSRIKTASLLESWCASKGIKPKIIQASGISYYGFFKDCNTICNETTPAVITDLFLQDLAIKCEQNFKTFDKISLRIAPVMQVDAGVFSRLSLPAKLGCGAKLGSGEQPMSWIALDDLLSAIIYIINNIEHISGPINMCSPEIISQGNFNKTLATAYNRPVLFKVPEQILSALGGEFAKQLLLHGQAAKPEKLLQLGFKFKYDNFAKWLRSNI